jgi:hypothetical protein
VATTPNGGHVRFLGSFPLGPLSEVVIFVPKGSFEVQRTGGVKLRVRFETFA